MKCSYPNRHNATVWPVYARRLKRLALALSFLVVACSQHWDGSVGAVLGKNNRDGRLYVREVPPDMGAAKVGIQPGDEVTAIAGKPVSSMTTEEVHGALAGAVGTKVKVTVSRDGQSLSFEIERGPLRGQ
jgi:C-terminal processing protease CtpA/Prc